MPLPLLSGSTLFLIRCIQWPEEPMEKGEITVLFLLWRIF